MPSVKLATCEIERNSHQISHLLHFGGNNKLSARSHQCFTVVDLAVHLCKSWINGVKNTHQQCYCNRWWQPVDALLELEEQQWGWFGGRLRVIQIWEVHQAGKGMWRICTLTSTPFFLLPGTRSQSHLLTHVGAFYSCKWQPAHFNLNRNTGFKRLLIVRDGWRFHFLSVFWSSKWPSCKERRPGVTAELFCYWYKRDFCHRKKKGWETLTNEAANDDSYTMTSSIIASEGNAWCVLCQEHIQLHSLPGASLQASFCIGQGLILRSPFEIFIFPPSCSSPD